MKVNVWSLRVFAANGPRRLYEGHVVVAFVRGSFKGYSSLTMA